MNYKKIIAIFMALTISATSILPAFAEELSDNEEISSSVEESMEEIEDNEEAKATISSVNEVTVDEVSDNNASDNTEELPSSFLSASLFSVNSSSNELESSYSISDETDINDEYPINPEGKTVFEFEDQGYSGLCWLFSAINAIKANIFIKTGRNVSISGKNPAYYLWHGVSEQADRSEDHALLNGYTVYSGNDTSFWYETDEGDFPLYNAFFAAWKGITSNTGKDKHPSRALSWQTTEIPDENNVYSDDICHVQTQVWDKCTNLTTDDIKRMIKKYGNAVTACNANTVNRIGNVEFNNKQGGTLNHKITLIGWDDNFAKEDLTTSAGTPNNNGAFRAVDSGGNIGWISYESKSLSFTGSTIIAFDVALPYTDDWYTHNYVGGNAGAYGNGFQAYGAPIGIEYKVNSSPAQRVKAVGFATHGRELRRGLEQYPDSAWTINVYKGTKNSATLMDSKDVSYEHPGFYTVKLDHPFTVNRGESFYIELIERSEGNTIEYAVPDDDMKWMHGAYAGVYCGAPYGKSYINNEDVSDSTQLVIHGYTTDVNTEARSTLTVSNNIAAVYGDSAYNLSNYYTFTEGVTTDNFPTSIASITSSNPEIISIDTKDGLNNAKAIIKKADMSPVRITITTSDGVTGTIDAAVARKSVSALEVTGLRDTYSDISRAVPVVKDGNKTLIKDTDYTVSITSNSTSEGTVTITGLGNYQGTRNITIGKITKSVLTARDMTVNSAVTAQIPITDILTFTSGYDGSRETAIREINIRCTRACTDATVWTPSSGKAWDSLKLNIYGCGEINIMASTNDSVLASSTITVTGAERAYKTVDMRDTTVEYNKTVPYNNGNQVECPAITVKYNGVALTEGVHYTCSRPYAYYAGTYDIDIYGIDRYTYKDNYNRTYYVGSKTCQFTVVDNNPVNNNPVDPGNNSPSPEPKEPQPEKEEKIETTTTIKKESNGVKVDITINKEAPYNPKPKELAKSFAPKLESTSGITIKSVKATKPKNGKTKVTIQLKGTTKEEKKAVKEMNKALKNMVMPVIPMDISKESVDISLAYKKNKQKQSVFNKVKKVKIGKVTLKNKTDYTYTTDVRGEDTYVIITGTGNYTGKCEKKA